MMVIHKWARDQSLASEFAAAVAVVALDWLSGAGVAAAGQVGEVSSLVCKWGHFELELQEEVHQADRAASSLCTISK